MCDYFSGAWNPRLSFRIDLPPTHRPQCDPFARATFTRSTWKPGHKELLRPLDLKSSINSLNFPDESVMRSWIKTSFQGTKWTNDEDVLACYKCPLLFQVFLCIDIIFFYKITMCKNPTYSLRDPWLTFTFYSCWEEGEHYNVILHVDEWNN